MRKPTAALLPATAMLLLLVVLPPPAAAATWNVSGRVISYRERSDEEVRLAFGAWKAMYWKTYISAGEEERRYAVFRDILRLVDRNNAADVAGVPVSNMGLNGLADYTAQWNAICCAESLPEESGLPSTGGRKERSGRSRSASSTVIHYFMHLRRAYRAAVASIWHWCAGEWGGESHNGAPRAGEVAGWEGESPRRTAVVSRSSTVAAMEPK